MQLFQQNPCDFPFEVSHNWRPLCKLLFIINIVFSFWQGSWIQPSEQYLASIATLTCSSVEHHNRRLMRPYPRDLSLIIIQWKAAKSILKFPVVVVSQVWEPESSLRTVLLAVHTSASRSIDHLDSVTESSCHSIDRTSEPKSVTSVKEAPPICPKSKVKCFAVCICESDRKFPAKLDENNQFSPKRRWKFTETVISSSYFKTISQWSLHLTDETLSALKTHSWPALARLPRHA